MPLQGVGSDDRRIRALPALAAAVRYCCAVALLVAALVPLLPTAEAYAHAALQEAYPQADSRLAHSPDHVALTFNERLEDRLYQIRVLDRDGDRVTMNAAELSPDRRTVSLRLPPLADGVYTVSYQVVSADGHPVQAAYVFAVGEADAFAGDVPAAPHDQAHRHGLAGGGGWTDVLRYGVRCLYYLSLLLVTGWVMWGALAPIDPLSPFKRTYRQASLALRLFYAAALAATIGVQLPAYIAITGWNGAAELLLGTNVGLSWGIGIALAALSFPLLHRYRLLDALWAILWPVSETLNGHAVATEPQAAAVPLNAVHLGAASLWAGGLLYVLLLSRRDRPALYAFLPRFAQAAMISLLVMAATGLAFTWLMLPDMRLLTETGWGRVLLVKLGVIALIVVTALMVRYRMRRREEKRLGSLLKLDFGLMVAVTAVVSVLTYLSPTPPNEPVFWHEAEGDIHLMVNIAPNQPGHDNRFRVEIWMPEDEGAPRSVVLNLHYRDDPDVHAIEVPLALTEKAEESPDYLKYAYTAEGTYFPFGGRWTAEVRVVDAGYDETVFTRDVRNYAY